MSVYSSFLSRPLFGLTCACFVLSACSTPAPEKPPEPVALVQTATATEGQIAARVMLYGSVEAGTGSELTLSAPSEAIVQSISAPAGSPVSAGTLIVQLAASPQSALDRKKAQSDATAADNAYARAGRLKADGLVSNAEVDAAHAVAQAADATRKSLSQRAGSLSLYAGKSGVVDAVLVKPGDLVAAGAPIVRIATGGDVRARFGVDPVTARTLIAGSGLRVQPLAGGAEIGLAVSSVQHVVDPTTRLAALFVNIPQSAGLALGEPLKAVLLRPSGTAGVTIPYAAVQDDGGTPYVYVVEKGVAHKHEVKLGAQADDTVLVLSGVAAGDVVVTQGGTAVEDKMKVRTGKFEPVKADKE